MWKFSHSREGGRVTINYQKHISEEIRSQNVSCWVKQKKDGPLDTSRFKGRLYRLWNWYEDEEAEEVKTVGSKGEDRVAVDDEIDGESNEVTNSEEVKTVGAGGEENRVAVGNATDGENNEVTNSEEVGVGAEGDENRVVVGDETDGERNEITNSDEVDSVCAGGEEDRVAVGDETDGERNEVTNSEEVESVCAEGEEDIVAVGDETDGKRIEINEGQLGRNEREWWSTTMAKIIRDERICIDPWWRTQVKNARQGH